MKPSETLELVGVLEASFSRDLSDESRKLWCQVLADVDSSFAYEALHESAATSNFPPTPQALRLRALEIAAGIPDFGEIWAELIDAADTCDYFDPSPPVTLSQPAYALARQLGWPDFRVSDPHDTYYVHQAQQRYVEITDRARRRMGQGLPAFAPPADAALRADLGALVDGIGEGGA